MFLIFVVAYIFYLGKSLSGPTPKEILKLPIFGTICLLSSSITVHLSVNGLKKKSQLSFIGWLAGTMLLGVNFSSGHRQRMVRTDLQRPFHHPHQPVRHHVLFSGRVARDPRPDWSIDVERRIGPGIVWEGR